MSTLRINDNNDLLTLRRLVKRFNKTGRGGDRLVFAYKFTDERGLPPLYSNVLPLLKYVVGAELSVPNALTDDEMGCGAGINVAARDWILNRMTSKQTGWLISFTVKDVAAVPIYCNDENKVRGKFRLFKATVLSKLDSSLKRRVK